MAEENVNSSKAARKPSGAPRTASSRGTARAAKAKASTGKAEMTAKTQEAEEVRKSTGRLGRTAARRVRAGQRAVTTVSKRAVSGAISAWTVLRASKAVAAGAGVGVAAAGACYAVGRKSAAQHFGPVTRLTGGRL